MSVATELAIASIRKELEKLNSEEKTCVLAHIVKKCGYTVPANLIKNGYDDDCMETISCDVEFTTTLTDVLELVEMAYDCEFKAFLDLKEDPEDPANEYYEDCAVDFEEELYLSFGERT